MGKLEEARGEHVIQDAKSGVMGADAAALAAEVESLRAEYTALDERAAIAVEVTGRRWSAVADELRAEVVSLRAAEARVRAVCKPDLDWSERSGEDLPLWVTEVLRALDGET